MTQEPNHQKAAEPKGDSLPMGVSEWREHGIKYGYWDYFRKDCLDRIRAKWPEKEKIISGIDVLKDSNLAFKNLLNKGFNQALDEALAVVEAELGEVEYAKQD